MREFTDVETAKKAGRKPDRTRSVLTTGPRPEMFYGWRSVKGGRPEFDANFRFYV